MIDEEAHRLPAEDLGEQHFDIRRRLGETRLDVCLQAAHQSLLPDNKKAGERPLSTTPAGDRPRKL
jgi:hypothetical protein